MAKFRKKPVVIDAFQWFPSMQRSAIPDWALAAFVRIENQDPGRLVVRTEGHGFVEASGGDWIIRGVKGEVYPCRADIFAETYEPVES